MLNKSLVGSIVILLAGCSPLAMKDAKETIKHDQELAESLIGDLDKNKDVNAGKFITFHDDLWLGSTVVESQHGEPLPSYLDDFNLINGDPLSFEAAIAKISARSGIPINIEEHDLEKEESDKTDDHVLAGDGKPFLANNDGLQFQYASEVKQTSDEPKINLQYSGPLSDLISSIAGSRGYDWTYENGIIRIFKYTTETYNIAAMPGTIKTASSLSSSASPSGSGGSSGGSTSSDDGSSGGKVNVNSSNSNEISFSAALNTWGELEDALGTIIGGQGRVSLSPSRGTITVTANRILQKKVERYLSRTNDQMVQQVVIYVDVYSVTLDKSDRFGLNPKLLFDNGTISGALASTTRDVGVESGGMSASATLIKPNLDVTGSSFVVDSLSSRGQVSTVNSASVITINQIPTPIQVVNSRAYQKKIQTTISESGNLQSTERIPDTVQTGFTLQLTPRIFSNGQVMMMYSLSLSDLLALEVFGDDEGQIQLPQVAYTGTIQHALMDQGETLVLAGFERIASTLNKETGLPGMIPLAGGSTSGGKSRQILVITIEPHILESKRFQTRG